MRSNVAPARAPPAPRVMADSAPNNIKGTMPANRRLRHLIASRRRSADGGCSGSAAGGRGRLPGLIVTTATRCAASAICGVCSSLFMSGTAAGSPRRCANEPVRVFRLELRAQHRDLTSEPPLMSSVARRRTAPKHRRHAPSRLRSILSTSTAGRSTSS
jgi:hypothetical protein